MHVSTIIVACRIPFLLCAQVWMEWTEECTIHAFMFLLTICHVLRLSSLCHSPLYLRFLIWLTYRCYHHMGKYLFIFFSCMKRMNGWMCVGSDRNILWARSWWCGQTAIVSKSFRPYLFVSAPEGCGSKCFPSLERRR